MLLGPKILVAQPPHLLKCAWFVPLDQEVTGPRVWQLQYQALPRAVWLVHHMGIFHIYQHPGTQDGVSEYPQLYVQPLII